MEEEKYNLIEISDFPELSELLSTDKIILFEEENGRLIPNLSSAIDLSSVALFPQDMEEINEKVEQTKTIINNAINYVKKTFITKTDAANMYATIAKLNGEFNKLETTTHFINSRLSGKAEKSYLERLANKIRAANQQIKYELGAGHWNNKSRGYKYLLVTKAGVKEE